MTKTLRFMMAMFMTAMTSVMMAATATWHYEWNTTKQNGGEGFYNFGSSFVDFDDYLTTTINGLTWHATATGTKKFAMTATGGQTVGTGASDNATHAAFWTDDITGKVKEVKVNARLNKAEYAGTVSVRVGDVVLGTQALSNEPTEYSFTTTADAERAYTIWYSTTANDFDELTDDPTIIPEKSGTIHIDHTCRLLLVTAGYNVFSPLVDLQFTIDESTGIKAVDDNQPANGSRLCDLQGRQVSTKHKGKGLYIRNGKKIIVK